MCYVAFLEPHFAAEFDRNGEWLKQIHRIVARLRPFTIDQNAIASFKSRTTAVPCRASTIGSGLFIQADYIIAGALLRGMQWQGMSPLLTLRSRTNFTDS